MHGNGKQESGCSRGINIEDVIQSANIGLTKSAGRSDMVFQPNDYRFLVLGSEDGSIEIFSVPKMKLLCILKSYQKLVQSLCWHPTYTGNSDNPSIYRNWLATSSNEADVHAWDLSSVLNSLAEGAIISQPLGNLNSSLNTEKGDENKPCSVPIHTQPSVILSGHLQRVIFVNWSPHEDGFLLSVSYDGTAQVLGMF